MWHESKSQTRIRQIDERLVRLRAERLRLSARLGQTARKRETRRKILVGAAVMAAVEHDGVPALRSTEDLLRWLDVRLTRAHDRTVFDLDRRDTASVDD